MPMVCLCCRIDLPKRSIYPVCQACVSKTKPAYPRPAKYLDALYCAGVFEGEWRELVHLYKYKGKEYLADFFFDYCLQRWELPTDRFDCVVPVPLSPLKTLKRGFNPPGLLAKKLALYWGKPFENKILKRRIRGQTQTNLGRQERFRNAAESYYFCTVPKSKKRRVALLVDDVFTTGATLSMCAKLLKEAGFEHVVGATIAYDPLLPNKQLSDTIRRIA